MTELTVLAIARPPLELIAVNHWQRLCATWLGSAVIVQFGTLGLSAQSRWSTEGYRSRGIEPGEVSEQLGAAAGWSSGGVYFRGEGFGSGDSFGGNRYRPPGYPFGDLNLGIILTPDWIGGWSGGPQAASGGYIAPGGEFSGQPLLNQPPFYSGQPAPNFYQFSAPSSGHSRSIPPHLGRLSPPPSGPPPAAAADGPDRGSAAASGESFGRRRSILVRPESDPALRQTIAAGTPAESTYETSLNAFARGDYEAALSAATAARDADPTNGKLLLYLAQCHFAVGEFEQSARVLSDALAMLPAEQWGLVIENFRQFYKRNDYVSQFDRLIRYSQQSGSRELGSALQAYHYRYLGHPEAAADQLQRALQSATPPRLAGQLKPLVLVSSQNPALGSPPSSVRRDLPQPTPAGGN